jgi:hypothetical protein
MCGSIRPLINNYILMKKIFLFTVLSLSVLTVQSQSEKFTKAMLAAIEKSKTAVTTAEYQDLANSFERIARSEKDQWTPWYYAAFYNLVINFTDSTMENKEKYIALAQQQIEEGLKLKPEETELFVIRLMSLFAELAIDPMKGMNLMNEVYGLIEKGKSLNPENPRIYLENAEMVFNMPVEFGGGKEKALPILLQAKEKFDTFVPADALAPNWGKERCEMLLSQCTQGK